jgi:antitoxin HicB
MAVFYEVVITMDKTTDGALSWMVTCPAFPEVTTFGDDQKEACVNGLRAVEEAISARISDNDPLPHPLDETNGKGAFVQLPALTFLKSVLYMICRESDVSRAELARRLGWHREQVDRLFRIDHKSQIDQIEAAFKALKVPLAFNINFPVAA